MRGRYLWPIFLVTIYFVCGADGAWCQKKKNWTFNKSRLQKDLGKTSRSNYQIDFPHLNEYPIYNNPAELAIIEKLSKKKDFEKLLPVLENYVSHFGIQNFYNDGHGLLSKLAQLYEKTNQREKAKAVYELLLKHQHSKDLLKITQHFDTLTADENDPYVPLEYYYELVEYRKNIDTLTPPHSILLNMGELVNDRKFPDYGPAMQLQNKILIFTKRRKELSATKLTVRENEELYYTKYYDGFWDEAQPFEKIINSHCNEGSACLSRDGKTLYFARCKVPDYQYDCKDCLGSCDIYVSQMKDDSTWGVPKNLGPNVNSKNWDSQPSLSHTEDTLYFASDRLGGFGLSDIWYTVKTIDDRGHAKWSHVKNMGPIINTKGNEVSPFYHPRYHVMYFSSNGQLLNFGKKDSVDYIYKSYDIYKSPLINGQWLEPRNVGPLVNGAGDEYYFTIDYDSKNLFYSKADENDKNLDLFSFPLPMEGQPTANTVLSGSLKDSLTGDPFKGIVSIIDLKNGIEVAPKFMRPDGSFEFDLIDDNDYLLVIQGDDFFRVEKKVHLNGDTSLHLETPSIKYNKWKFQTLEFENGSAEILEEMHSDLDKVGSFLIDHPDFKLKISGHTDSDGNADGNLKLSQKRADSIKEYIIKQDGVERSRIEAVGYGSQKPIVVEETAAHKAINRRVEFELIRPAAKETPAEEVPAEEKPKEETEPTDQK